MGRARLSGFDLSELEDVVGGLLAKSTPAERRKLARAIGLDLRRANVQRIAAQREPDGAPFAPRKPRPKPGGRLRDRRGGLKSKTRSRAMFAKLRRAAYLGLEANAEGAAVGFANAVVARIARVHQEGLRDRVERKPGAPEVQYARRRLLGVSPADREHILDQVLAHLQAP